MPGTQRGGEQMDDTNDLGTSLLADWETLYAEALNSEQTLECSECGDSFYGESPSIVIVCWLCYRNLYKEKV